MLLWALAQTYFWGGGCNSALPPTSCVALDMLDPSPSLTSFLGRMKMVIPTCRKHPSPCPSFKLYDLGPLTLPFHASVFSVVG